MMGGVFVTGTDTGVGKTWVSTRVLEELRSRGVRAAGLKPIECGGRDDARSLLAASRPGLSLDEVNPVAIEQPLAPAAVEGAPEIRFEALVEHAERLAADGDLLVVEGAGGWLVPVDKTRTMADLAVRFGYPVLVVAADRLGVLNHTLLTVRAIRESGLTVRAVFLNCLDQNEDPSRKTNGRILQKYLEEIPVIQQDTERLASLLLDDEPA